VTKHLQSECFLGYLHEHIAKEVAVLLGMVPASELKADIKRGNDWRHLLPSGTECKFCGIDLASDSTVHAFFCEHPLLHPILESARTGTKHPKVAALLHENASKRMVAAVEEQQPKRKSKLVNSDRTVVTQAKKLRAGRAKARVDAKAIEFELFACFLGNLVSL